MGFNFAGSKAFAKTTYTLKLSTVTKHIRLSIISDLQFLCFSDIVSEITNIKFGTHKIFNLPNHQF